ncbi:uncharacterized protein PV06_00357 [Exophiala oligosperma]|uniref:Transcription factor domain-containing protein n=1 Tax=Exophiala oligosperma TaxID=215243 RepID=A0A0D2DX57_9EURO|nr:uncharacterized protein PV06_00357 [Exophiala oligosperma]KIW47688.1 hypothetical protein PV06_00357 [Exophiala oligosperma]
MSPSSQPKRELHFVTVSSIRSASSTSPDPKQRKSLRSFVMQDYLRQKNDPNWHFAPAKVDTQISSHIYRFRSSRPASSSSPDRKRTAKARRPREAHAASRQPRRLLPAGAQSTQTGQSKVRDVVQSPRSHSRLHDLDMLDPFQTLSIDLSDPDTVDLLQYYHSSFWANSYACNPEGRWISIALMDPAIIHATLCLVAIHRRDIFSISLSKDYFNHRGLAMKIVAGRLNDPAQAVSDATVGAVAILSSSDHHFEWPDDVQETHAVGLAELVALRGGIEKLTSNRHVQRVTGWADLLQCAMHGTKLRMKLPSNLGNASPVDVEAEHDRISTQRVPGLVLSGMHPRLASILGLLRRLAALKADLLDKRSMDLCQSFSDLLWKLEYTILEKQDQTGREDPTESSLVHVGHELCDSVGRAALIMSYSHLRDLAAPILYDKLSARLRSTLSTATSQTYARGLLVDSELAVLLWVLNLGLRGSKRNLGDKLWFAGEMARVCWNNGVLSLPDLHERTQSVVPQAQEALDMTERNWRMVESLIWLESEETW